MADPLIGESIQGDNPPRLLILGENSMIDSLAVVEFTARVIAPHLSFRIRMRWLPGFKRRLRHLGLLTKEQVWWRGVFVPLALAGSVVVLWVIGALAMASFVPDFIKGSLTFSHILHAKSSLPDSFVGLAGVPLEMLPYALLQVVASQGGIAPFVWLASLVSLHAPLFLLVAIGLRLGRALKGLFYSATGTFLFVGSKACLRFRLASSGLEDEEALQVAISYLQIIEQVLTNRIIDVLQRYGINTDCIRDEVKSFINEGIYMTGGEFRASNVLVGKRGILGMRKQRAAKIGRQTVLGKARN